MCPTSYQLKQVYQKLYFYELAFYHFIIRFWAFLMINFPSEFLPLCVVGGESVPFDDGAIWLVASCFGAALNLA